LSIFISQKALFSQSGEMVLLFLVLLDITKIINFVMLKITKKL